MDFTKKNREEETAIYVALLDDPIVNGPRLFHPHPRHAGSSPSIALYESENRKGEIKVRWWCHRNGHGGDAWSLLKMMLGDVDFSTARAYLNKQLETKQWSVSTGANLHKAESIDPVPIFKDHPDTYDLQYFNRLGIPTWKLERDDMLYLRKLQFSEYTSYYSTPVNPIYAWRVGEGLKVYQPLGDRSSKHRNLNLDPLWLDGMSNVKEHVERLYIVSSRKDRMIVDTNHHIINPTGGENNTTVWEERRGDVMAIADKVFVLNDGDDAGWQGAQKIAHALGSDRAIALDIRPFFQNYRRCKDFGDIADKFNPVMATLVMTQIDSHAKNYTG